MIELKYQHLLGFPFVHGSRDCYELARDFYRDNWGIELVNLARPENWWDHGMNLYMDHFASQGFYAIDVQPRDLLPGDGFLMNILSDVANHCAIYLGEGKILHHRYGCLSCVENYDHGWRRRTLATLRHRQVVIGPSELRQMDLQELLPPSMRAALVLPGGGGPPSPTDQGQSEAARGQ